MEYRIDQLLKHPDFRVKATFSLSVMALMILTPFSANNFIQGRILLGLGSLFIVGILGYNAWSIRRGHFPTALTLFGLVPAIVLFLCIAIQKQGVIGILWCYPALFSFYMMLPERQAWLANAILVLTAVPTAWLLLDHSLTIRIGATLLSVSLFAVIFLRVITDQQNKLQLLAVTDALTGTFNRVMLQEDLMQAIRQHRRSRLPMVVLALDLDHFKLINDRFGHDTGDQVLRGIGELLRTRLRGSDRVYRLGGEEFLALLHDTDETAGVRVAEDLRKAIEAARFVSDIEVTTSIGVAALRDDEEWNDWLKRADARLYEAKAAGRGRVTA